MSETIYSGTPFFPFLRDVYSQNGEDGIVEEVLKRLYGSSETSNEPFEGICVEFGAWDGVHLSNTFNLVESAGWKAIYIEGDPSKYEDLVATCSRFPKIEPYCAYVSADRESEHSLDNILKEIGCPKEFHLLSIDIDSYDLEIWESLEEFQPDIVIIEINSNFPPGIELRQCHENGGSTFSSTLKVARNKGYELICHTGNLFFVRREILHRVKFPERYLKYPELLFRTDWLDKSAEQISFRTLIKQFLRRVLRRLGVK